MGARLTDSALYAHLWGTDELRGVFDEGPRLQGWLDVLAALARAQADLGIIPEEAASAIAGSASVELLDLAAVAEETRRTGHSTLGLIRGLQAVLPGEAREWLYYGATVQDITDTWSALAAKRVLGVAWRDLRAIEDLLRALAERHRDTIMAGRTHGQTGAPITFGFKAAGWADEVRRHIDRLREAGPRLLAGQLGGGVGTLGFFGTQGPALRRRFCDLLGLVDPAISWTSARDRPAELAGLLAVVTATLARIGNEVYQLSRPEIGELAEAQAAEVVGSITMPHKRNPEIAEHLVTLSRLVRAQAGVVIEGMVAEGERDGRGWKAEWSAVPEACLLAATALGLTQRMLAGLAVHPDAMRRNLGAMAASEQLLAAMAPRAGKHAAQDLLQRVLAAGGSLEDAAVAAGLNGAGVPAPDAGSAGAMVDEVLGRARLARASEPEVWP